MSAFSLQKTIRHLVYKLEHFDFGSHNEPIIQLSALVSPVPVMAWLASQTCYPKIYWRGRDSQEEVAAVGCCKDFTFDDNANDDQLTMAYQQQRALSTQRDIRYYGGVAFDRKTACWEEYGQCHFVLPRIELRRCAQEYRLIVNLNLETGRVEQERQAALACLQQLCPLSASSLDSPQKFTVLNRQDYPEYCRWKELVDWITETSFIDKIPKVVLSRLTQFEVTNQIDPWPLLTSWQRLNPNSFQFGFQFSQQRAFISCTPERLYHRQRRQLFTEALAGTTTRGQDESEDMRLAQQLLNDKKSSHENRLVSEHIVAALTPLSDRIDSDGLPRIFRLNRIQHLHQLIKAQLKEGVDDLQILLALHPTPAVGGSPTGPALEFIRQQEGYIRGWYSGACGYFSRYESEFAVAIRSALIEPEKINLFAGAGIVSGSKADAEWRELENKLATILSLLPQKRVPPER